MRRPASVASRRAVLGLVLAAVAVVCQLPARPQRPTRASAATARPVETVQVTEDSTTTAGEPSTTTSSEAEPGSTAPASTTTTSTTSPPPPGFIDAVQRALHDPRFENATVGLAVSVEGSGVVLDQDADTAMHPGSNEKLLVAWGAYELIGAPTVLTTDVRAGGALDGGTLSGDLFVVGGGDPSLRSTGDHSLDRLAALVRAAGVTEVTGDVVADESRFDSERRAPGWAAFHVPAFVGPVSALAVDGNVLRTDPDYLANPALGNVGAFRAALARHGVHVAGGERMGTAPGGAPAVASIASAPVSDLLRFMLTNSDNFYAEMLLKDIGRRVWGLGTAENGVAAIRQVALDAGVRLSPGAVDGSGLSRDDTRPPREWLDLLLAARSRPWFDQFVAGLPVAGRTGTLATRFLGTPVEGNLRAKTGSVRETRALSGYLTTAGGRSVVFSLVVNANPLPAAVIPAMDAVVTAMAANRG